MISVSVDESALGVIAEESSREHLFRTHIPFVRSIAYKIFQDVSTKLTVLDCDDFVSVGLSALWDLAEKYDPSKGSTFKTYAAPRVRGAILDVLRENSFLPRSSQANRKVFENQKREKENEVGYSISFDEMVDVLGLDQRTIVSLERSMNLTFINLDAPSLRSKDSDDSEAERVADDRIEHPLHVLTAQEDAEFVGRCMKKISSHHAAIIRLYFWNNLPLKKIAVAYDVTESRISQILDAAIGELKKVIQDSRD
jgi:RNA polymerase sigma factor for flagellar operon FliA